MEVPMVSPQAGKGGAELDQLGALARYAQAAIGQDGAPVKAVAPATATGSFTFTGTGTAGDTVSIAGFVITLVDSDPGANEAEVGQSAGDTRDNVLAALQVIAGDAGVSVASSSTAAITVTALVAGTGGNTITLTTDSDATVSAMSGGTAGTVGTAAPAGSIRVDGTDAWIAVKDTTEADTSGWLKLTLGGGL